MFMEIEALPYQPLILTAVLEPAEALCKQALWSERILSIVSWIWNQVWYTSTTADYLRPLSSHNQHINFNAQLNSSGF